MTSSARASSVGGTSSPSALADLRLNLVGACTGRSAGFSPFIWSGVRKSIVAAAARYKLPAVYVQRSSDIASKIQDEPHALPLRARCDGPRSRTAENGDELAPFHWMTCLDKSAS